MRVLVVEDEPRLSRQLAEALGQAGYAVDCATDGERADFLGQTEGYDAVVLDLGLPKVDGLTVLRRWRDAGVTVPVLVLTARSSWHETVQGIDAGADDYLSKPFRLEELLARLRALIRRARRMASSEIRCGAITMDSRAAKVTRDGQAVKLTALEFRVLAVPDAPSRARRASERAHRPHLRDQRRSRFQHHRSLRRAAAPQAGGRRHRNGARPRVSGRGGRGAP